jgi:hypothetical protein
MLATVSCGASGDPIVRDYPSRNDPQCRPANDDAARIHQGASGSEFGAAFDRLLVRRSAEDVPIRLVAVGGPGADHVQLFPHQAPPWTALATLPASAGSGLVRHGHAIVAADVLEMSELDPETYQNAGHELIIGAPHEPDTQGNAGWISLWSPLVPKEGAGFNIAWQFKGQWRPDGSGGTTAATGSARFGAALAAAPHDPFSSIPHPAFVVVGGPGDRRVWVLAVDPEATSAAGAFSEIGTLALTGSSFLNNRFGESLTLADLNQDGFPDLVVSNPNLIRTGSEPFVGGAVHIVPGVGAGAGYFDWSNRVLLLPDWPSATPQNGDGFGTSVAVGHYAGRSSTARSLAIGAPGLKVGDLENAGGVCVQRFVHAGAEGTPKALTLDGDIACFENPYAALELPNMRWGTSTLALNAAPRDNFGDETFDEGLAQELVVGCPGCRGFTVDSEGELELATSPTGRVFVYGSTVDGPLIVTPSSPELQDLNRDWPLEQLPAPTGFSDYPSRLYWMDAEDNGARDIVAVSESARRLHVTVQQGDPEVTAESLGEFATVDADGAPFTLRFFAAAEGKLNVDLLDRIDFRIFEPGDPDPVACSAGAFTGQEFIPTLETDPLPMPFAREQTSVQHGEPAVEVRIQLGNGGANMRGNLTFSNNGTPTSYADDFYTFEYLGVWSGLGVRVMGPPCAMVIDGTLTSSVVFTRTSNELPDACLP